MTTIIDYALMAGASYISTRADINQFPVPQDWIEDTGDRRVIKSSGFEATYFTKGSEIVISYAGTDPSDIFGDLAADIALAAGVLSDQLRQAADYYLAVKASVPEGTKITFTGHSLGGGIASLMAVFFGESATTFDQAPFLRSTVTFLTDTFGNSTTQSVAIDLRNYLTSKGFNSIKLDAFITAANPSNPVPIAADTLAGRQQAVTNINTEGEFLSSWYSVPSSNRIGSQADIANSHEGLGLLGGIDLHAIELLTAFLQSDPNAATNTDPQTKSLNRVTFKLPDLLKMIFDEKLFAYDRGTGNKDNEDFLTRIVRHQAGTSSSSPSDDMVKRFTSDLWKLAQDGGLTISDGSEPDLRLVSDTLIAFAMQMYYGNTANASNKDKQLFSTDNVTGGIQFDVFDVSEKFQEQFTADGKIDLKKAKGYKEYFAQYLNDALHSPFTAEERGQINYLLSYLRDWYVQAGAEGMTATDTQNRGAFMLGGTGSDTLTGGTADDLLVGNTGADTLDGGEGNDILLGGAGEDNLKGGDGKYVDMLIGGADNDTLDGGQGNDILKGGTGNDTYTFIGDYGVDIITDSDGSGTIQVDGQPLGSGTQTFDSVYKDDASGQIFVKLNGGQNLVILKEDKDNRILVNNWPVAGTLGITLQDKTLEAPTVTLAGDFKKKVSGSNTYVMDGDNYAKDGDEANALDLITGTTGKDVIDGGGGDDALSGREGDDYIMGGAGGDIIQGGLGKDTIYGGTGDDAIYGSSEMAFDKPQSIYFTKPVNDYLHPQGTGFNWTSGYTNTAGDGVPIGYTDAPRNRLDNDQGNIIDGGIGNDFISAGTGADIVHGGTENDWIYGMDKGDVLFGDGGNDLIHGDGNQPESNSIVWTRYEDHGNDVIDGGSGNDYLYGQGGDDIVFGGDDNDHIWGDDEETELPVAHHGNDVLFGGAGTDELRGGAGNDYLEGGTGIDKIWGGTGDDVYFFNAGDGVDELHDNKGEHNIIRFGEGVDASTIDLKLGSLMLDMGNGDAIHIEDFDRNDVFNSSSITSFEFYDGSTLSLTELLARGFDIEGTDGSETIYGTNTNDRIDGKGGTDVLIGGAGDDTYIFHVGDSPIAQQDGHQALESVDDSAGVDTVALSEVDPGSIHVGMAPITDPQQDKLIIQYGVSDQLLLSGGANGTIESFKVGGETLTFGEFIGRYADSTVSGTNEGGQALLNGGRSDDFLATYRSRAIISGGRGNDTLRVTGANSTLLYSLGDGRDEIVTGGSGNVLRLGEGIALADVKVVRVDQDALTLQVGSATDDILHFTSFSLDNQTTIKPFETIEFADGSTIGFSDFMAKGFTLRGTDGNDSVNGLAGNDDLDGGAGNDALVGSAGSDTYHFGIGSGRDTIDGKGNNSYDADQLVVGAGLSSSDLQFFRRGENLIIRTVVGNDQITAHKQYAGGNIETIAFNDGSTWGAADINAHTLDMFVLDSQQGAVSATETSPLGAIVQLGSGLEFSDIVATKSGNDLLLQVRGTQADLRITNYYNTDPALWSVLDNSGQKTTTTDLLAATALAQADLLTSLKQDFVTSARLGIADELADSGYSQGTDGFWHRTSSLFGAANSKSVTDQLTSTQYTWYNGSPSSTSTQNLHTETWDATAWNANVFTVNVDTATVERSTTSGVDSVIYSVTYDAATLAKEAQANVYWELTSSWALASQQYSSTALIYGGTYGQYAQDVVGQTTTSTQIQGASYQYQAKLVQPLTASSVQYVDSTTISGSLPNALSGLVNFNSNTYLIQEIDLSDGNHEVYGDARTMVIAGAGDSFIFNAGFAYGGVGNSSLIGGHILVAGQGDQTLENGDIMVVGDGHDRVLANAGNRIDIRSDNVDIDLISSNANQSMASATLYYQQLGISDWKERYQYGGQYRCDADGQNVYVDSAQKAIDFFSSWGGGPHSLQWLLDEGWATKVETLPTLVKFAGLDLPQSTYYEQHHIVEQRISATDFSILNPYYESGQLVPVTVSFDKNLALSDLHFSWGEGIAPGHSGLRTMLNISWGSNQGIQVAIADSGDKIGQGAYRFEFGDGSKLNLSQMIALAPVAPSFDHDTLQFGQGAGTRSILGGDYRAIHITANLSKSDLSFGHDGTDLLITSNTTNDVVRIQGWYENPAQTPSTELKFSDGTYLSPTTLTRMGMVIEGGPGSQTLRSLAGFATTLVAGSGDTLIGSNWGDVYAYAQGTGSIHIQDRVGGTIQFGSGITSGMLSLDVGAKLLKIGGNGDKIYLDNFDPSQPEAGITVQSFMFADGSVLTYDQLIEMLLGERIDGTSGDDELVGNNFNDRIDGGAGNDWIIGGAGQDTLIGGAGDDSLSGDSGNDIYLFGRGDGNDQIWDDDTAINSADEVRFGPDITPQDVSVSSTALGDVVLSVSGTDTLMLEYWLFADQYKVEKIKFADGTVWGVADVMSMISTSPTEGGDYITGKNGNDYIDALGGDDGVSGGAGDDVLKGDSGNDELDGGVGSDLLFGGNGSDSLYADLSELNSANDLLDAGSGDDYLRGSIGRTLMVAGQGNDMVSATGNNTNVLLFNRGDGQDVYNLYLPNYVTSFADTLSLGGGMGYSDLAFSRNGNDLVLKVAGTSDSLTFMLWFNDSHYHAVKTLQFIVDAMPDYDPNGSNLLLTKRIEQFDFIALTQQFEAAKAADPGITSWPLAPHLESAYLGGSDTEAIGGAMAYSYGKSGNLSVVSETQFRETLSSTQFGVANQAIAIAPENHAPVVATPLTPQKATQGMRFQFVMPDNAFSDADAGDVLTLTATQENGSPLPAWMIFDAINRQFSGQPENNDVGAYQISVKATDTSGASVTSGFSVSVVNVNDAPTGAVSVTGTALQNQVLNASNTLGDVDGLGTIAYQWQSSTDGNTWSSIYNATASSFTLKEAQVGKQVRAVVSYTDGHGTAESIASAATGLVANVNDAPTGSVSVTGTVTENQVLTASNTLADADGLGVVGYQWQSSTDGTTWSAINGATATSFSLSEAQVGKQVRAVASYTDGHGTAESVASAATVSVAKLNSAPVLAIPLSNQVATEGIAFSLTLPAGSFTDPDAGDTLSYTAKLSNGAALPAWLTFNATTKTLSGTASQTDLGSLQVIVTATDGGGLSANANFQLDVAAHAAVSLTGTTGNDVLTGFSGADTLNGGTGADQLIGRDGNDTYIVDNVGDVVVEAANEGIDLVQSSVIYTLAANVDNLTLTGTTAINGTGNALDNVLVGNSAANVLTGGAGNDTYYVSTGDTVTEAASAGTDTVMANVTWTLGSNLENLVLTGTAAINGTGNTLNNVLTGNSVANTLSGSSGADTMIGGAGNDTYVVDNTADVATEALNEGTDLVQSSVTYTLSANVENLTLTGTTAINGTGNALDNALTGNTAANTLTGGAGNDTLSGGTGADTMIGGTGNDTYVVDNTADVATEALNEGTDLVQSSVTYTLSANVENLTLTGTSALNGTGNALDNILTGNSANNTLTGGDGNDTINGGTGNDTMFGGLGDDVYVVNVATDIVTEAANAGNDTIQSAVTLTLTTNVENLVLTGTTAINGTGNTLNNLVRGNTGINTLNGGTGNDILEGGAGNDILTDTSGTALFNGGAGADTITGGAGAEIFLGGLGNDTYTTAGGNDIILFNKGDGQDTFATGGTGSDIISLGGGITYADLVFTKATNDLVLKIGATDQITFKNWYATTPSKPVTKLQVMAEAMADFVQGGSDALKDQKVENFNFAGLAGAFDTARTANPTLTSWALMNALTSFQLAGSDTAALGGDLAYQYGKNGTLAGIGVTPALTTLSDANLGTAAQTLTPLSGLQTGSVRLS